MRLSIVILFLMIIWIFPAYGFPTANSTAEQKEVNQNDIYSEIGIGIAFSSLIFGILIFYVQDRQGKRLKKLVVDVHEFAEDQKSIKNAKRTKYSKMILFGLQLIDYEIEGMTIQQRLRDHNDQSMSYNELKQMQIDDYEKAQKRFLDVNIEYDVMLEIFSQEIENQYRQTWNVLRTPSIYVNFDDSEKIWEMITKIAREFANLKNLLMPYVDPNEKNTFSDLFDLKRYTKKDNGKPVTA